MQARRDSNPQHPVLETGALAIGATGLYHFRTRLARLLVHRVFVAKRAVLFVLNSLRMLSLILGRKVVPPLAFSTGQYDFISWHNSNLSVYNYKYFTQ